MLIDVLFFSVFNSLFYNLFITCLLKLSSFNVIPVNNGFVKMSLVYSRAQKGGDAVTAALLVHLTCQFHPITVDWAYCEALDRSTEAFVEMNVSLEDFKTSKEKDTMRG